MTEWAVSLSSVTMTLPANMLQSQVGNFNMIRVSGAAGLELPARSAGGPGGGVSGSAVDAASPVAGGPPAADRLCTGPPQRLPLLLPWCNDGLVYAAFAAGTACRDSNPFTASSLYRCH